VQVALVGMCCDIEIRRSFVSMTACTSLPALLRACGSCLTCYPCRLCHMASADFAGSIAMKPFCHASNTCCFYPLRLPPPPMVRCTSSPLLARRIISHAHANCHSKATSGGLRRVSSICATVSGTFVVARSIPSLIATLNTIADNRAKEKVFV